MKRFIIACSILFAVFCSSCQPYVIPNNHHVIIPMSGNGLLNQYWTPANYQTNCFYAEADACDED